MLEVARILSESGCRLKRSVVFAAFDQEELRAQGSLQFVEGFLIPEVVKRFGHESIAGAIVADTILNYNDTEGSQEVGSTKKDAHLTTCPAS